MKKGNPNIKEKVRVAIRVRPYLEQELPYRQDVDEIVLQDKQLLDIQDEKTINVFNTKLRKGKAYTFDEVLSPEISQEDLYDQ